MPGSGRQHGERAERKAPAQRSLAKVVNTEERQAGHQRLRQAYGQRGRAEQRHEGDHQIRLQGVHPRSPGDQIDGVVVSRGIHAVIEQRPGIVARVGFVLIQAARQRAQPQQPHRAADQQQRAGEPEYAVLLLQQRPHVFSPPVDGRAPRRAALCEQTTPFSPRRKASFRKIFRRMRAGGIAARARKSFPKNALAKARRIAIIRSDTNEGNDAERSDTAWRSII